MADLTWEDVGLDPQSKAKTLSWGDVGIDSQPAPGVISTASPNEAWGDPMTGLIYTGDPQKDSAPARMLGGYAAGAVQPAVGLAQLAGHGLDAVLPQSLQGAGHATDVANDWLTHGTPEYESGVTVGKYTAPFLMAPFMPMGAATTAARAGVPGLLARIGMGAGTGAALGATTPVDNPDNNFWGQKATQTELGAGIGGILPALTGAARAMFPAPSQAAQTMIQAGIQPTPGASGGVPGIFENIVSKFPFVNHPIMAAREGNRAAFDNLVTQKAQDFERGAINRVLGNVGEGLDQNTKTGSEAIQEMIDKVGDAYQKAIPKAGGAFDQDAQNGLASLVQDAQSKLPTDRAKQFTDWINTNISGKVQNGSLTGQVFRDVDQDLRNEAHSYLNGGAVDEQKLGQSYRDLQGYMRDWLARVNPQSAQEISAANAAYRESLPVIDAAGGGQGGRFDPNSLLNSARKFGGRSQFARGQAPMQDVAREGAADQQAFTQAGQQSGVASGGKGAPGGHTGGLLGNIVAAGAIEQLLEHALSSVSPWITAGGAALGYPGMMTAYSKMGRGLLNNLLGQSLPFSPSLVTAPIVSQMGVNQLSNGGSQ